MKRYVIIGNGTAAVGCIEGIRSVEPEGKITVVSGENRPAYCRPLISYYLEGKTDLDKMNYRPQDFYDKNGCDVLYGVTAVSLDGDNKTLLLSNGDSLEYDELCVATGSAPFVPPFEGLDTVEKRFTFMTEDDALALEQAIDGESDVLIIGAGLIGLKCAEGIRDRVKSVTVCDLADRVLSTILDRQCSEIMLRHLENEGLTLMLEDSVQRFEGNTAHMKSGKTVSFDVLVLAVGVRANTAIVKNAGGQVNRGIIIDSRSRTTLPSVYAAGDCAEGMDISLGARRVLAILPNAYLQSRTAGVNMAGGDAAFDNPIPMNSIGLFGLHVMTAGSYFTEEQGGRVYDEPTECGIKRFFVKDNLLSGFIIIGDTDRAGIYTALIREKTPLDSIDFDALRKAASLEPFSRESRGNKLGGVV